MEEDEPEIPEAPIHRAARLGDITELRRLIAAGEDVNARAKDSALTPLMVAAHSTDGATVETLAFLREAGANLHAVAKRGRTAIWYAADSGPDWWEDSPPILPDQAERLLFLLDMQPSQYAASRKGSALLHLACRVGDPAKVRLLLDHGVSPNPIPIPEQEAQSSSSRWSPLLLAARSGAVECVRMLLDAGADPNFAAGGQSNTTALAETRSPEVARLLLAAGARPDALMDRGRDVPDSVLANAEEGLGRRGSDGFAVAQMLLDAGAPLELADQYGWSRLYRAAFRGYATSVDFLLARGASCAPNTRLSTPLHVICWNGAYESCERIIRALVAAGIPIEAQDDEGRTPLHKAIGGDMSNKTAAVTLLSLGAELEPVDKYGQTPLHLAAKRGEIDCIELLLSYGANPLRKDMCQQTPMDLAREHEQMWREIITQNEPWADLEERIAWRKEVWREASHAYILLKEAVGE